LLEGFSDDDGDVLAVSGLVANQGSVTDNGDGTFTITPTAGYRGSVSLTYDVVDGAGGSTAATQSFVLDAVRSEERRVGKECIIGGKADTEKKIATNVCQPGFVVT